MSNQLEGVREVAFADAPGLRAELAHRLANEPHPEHSREHTAHEDEHERRDERVGDDRPDGALLGLELLRELDET